MQKVPDQKEPFAFVFARQTSGILGNDFILLGTVIPKKQLKLSFLGTVIPIRNS